MEQQNHDNGISMFDAVLTVMRDTYLRKNADYGDSFRETMEEYGLTALNLRLADKLNRLKSLSKSAEPAVKGESIVDTLLDIANYAVMGAMYVAPTCDNDTGGASHSIMGIASVHDFNDKFAELNTYFTKAKEKGDKKMAGIALHLLKQLVDAINGGTYPIDNQPEVLQALQNMSLILEDILQGGVEHVVAEPIGECGIDAQLLYDYQQLCAFARNPTEEGLPSAYEAAKRIMGTEVSKGGGDRDFISNAIGLAKEVVDAYEERKHSQGVVVPFRNGDASAEK